MTIDNVAINPAVMSNGPADLVPDIPTQSEGNVDWHDFVSANHTAPQPQPDQSVASSSVSPSPSADTPPRETPQLQHITQDAPLQGFDNLDPVQRYAIGALAVVLLNRHATDLNGVAFARTQSLGILDALCLRSGQQEAILALDPSDSTRDAVIAQCVSLVGAPPHRFHALQAMLALAVVAGRYDARSRAFLVTVADNFGIAWPAVAAVELAVAVHLLQHHAPPEIQQENADLLRHLDPHDGAHNDDGETTNPLDSVSQNTMSAETTNRDIAENSEVPTTTNTTTKNAPPSVDKLLIERRKKKHRVRKAIKIGGITLVGGVLFGLTGGLIAPALLSALAGVGVASAAGLAASGSLASGAVVGGLFGVAGGGFTLRKARNRISTNLEEFDFERPGDPRVVEERERKANRARRKLEKLVALRLAEQAAANSCLAIEGREPSAQKDTADIDSKNELPPPPPQASDDDIDDVDDFDNDDDSAKQKKRRGPFDKQRKKREKLKVGARGLEAAAQIPSLHVCICVPAWLTNQSFGSSLDQFEAALKVELPCSQHIAVRWESRRLYEMGLAFAKFWASKATVTTVQQAYPHAIAAASTVAGAVAFAFAIPLTVMSCMDYIDNPWSVLVSRSNGAGEELADVLVERSYGHRPVTLFGYSIGARVIFKCLECLASRGAFGIVENVFMMGAAVTADPERWKKIRGVVAGRIVNAYGTFDWALAFFHRGCGHGVYVSGLRRVEVEGVENLNMAYLGVEGHRELKDSVPSVMHAMGVGLGYISMPPAKLVIRGSKRPVEDGALQDTAVCEEPGGEDWGGTQFGGESGEPIEDENRSSLDSSSGLESGDGGVSRHRPTVGDDVSMVGDDDSSGGIQRSRNGRKESRSKKKKSKSKSWLSWGTWSASSSKGKSSTANRKNVARLEETSRVGMGVESMQMEDVNVETNRSRETVDYDGMQVAGNSSTLDGGGGDDMNEEMNGVGQCDVKIVDEIDSESNEAEEGFDWDKQRDIWEEQERQMNERGFADTAEEIEMGNKVVLTISVEVAGRRLEHFVEQDVELPSLKKEMIFTNCVDDQRGMHIRVYEHEKGTKSMPYNMLKWEKRYPKLIAELDVRLRQAAVKGKVRVAVGVSADENGDVYAYAEERFGDGSVGSRVESCVPRSELCTFEERSQLEEAEKERLESKVDEELKSRAARLTLPAPSSSSSTTNATG